MEKKSVTRTRQINWRGILAVVENSASGQILKSRGTRVVQNNETETSFIVVNFEKGKVFHEHIKLIDEAFS